MFGAVFFRPGSFYGGALGGPWALVIQLVSIIVIGSRDLLVLYPFRRFCWS